MEIVVYDGMMGRMRELIQLEPLPTNMAGVAAHRSVPKGRVIAAAMKHTVANGAVGMKFHSVPCFVSSVANADGQYFYTPRYIIADACVGCATDKNRAIGR